MGYNKIIGILDNQEDRNFLNSLTNDRLDKPRLISFILDIISDESEYIHLLSDTKLLSLYRLAKEYFNSCFSIFLDQSSVVNKLEFLIEYCTTTIYNTDGPDGLRVSTESEVKEGIEELIPVVTHNISEDIEGHLNLLLWTFTGALRYYKAAGLTYTYSEGRLQETKVQLIFRAGEKLRHMVDWISQGGNYERTLAVLKIARKNKNYRYPTYAHDEIKSLISIKQVEYICRTRIGRHVPTDIQKEANAIIFKMDKHKYKPTPYDKSILRKAYNEIQEGIVGSNDIKLDTELEQKIAKIENGFSTGRLNKNHFSLKIIPTIRTTGKCSPKQMAYLDEAINIIEDNVKRLAKKAEDKDKVAKAEGGSEGDTSEKELMDMYNALGSGVLNI